MLNDYHGQSNIVKRSTIPGTLGHMSTSSTAGSTGPRWLSADEQCTWRDFLTASQWLFASVDGQLQRDAGIPLAYYEILVRLSEAPGRALRMTQLAAASASSKSRVSHAVARLEERGWVRRTDCPTDRRGQVAQLTDEGFAALSAAAQGHVEQVRRVLFDPLSAEQLHQLAGISETILAAAASAPADGDCAAALEDPAT
jgi:DNA-binding MarR family transcriptional regulator